MKIFVIGLGLGITMMMASSVSAQEDHPTCSVSGSDMTAFAALDYDAFNYGPDGWRSLSSKKCFFDAGASIVSWLVDHEGDLDGPQLRTQHYQAARNFALADRKQIALLQLRLAQDNTPAKLGAMDWNAYLAAFNAWLSEDKAALDQAIERLKKQATGSDGRKPNLDAALRFKRCFSKPYIMIEQDPSCIATPSSE
ncbi:MAG: hypothetical protein Q9M33_10965 [Robiginitomaculum sp.]|nr:hypothetical protein [Robiginitomaculum sp.]MDQ7076968.1 hypothetical protein [Robiginitomaculum sp.]